MQLGDLVFQVTEDSIATVAELPRDGELWFKNRITTGVDYNQFLKMNIRILTRQRVSLENG